MGLNPKPHPPTTLSSSALLGFDSVIENLSKTIRSLSTSFPRVGLNALPEDLGLNIHTVWEDYSGTVIRSWTQILNYEGSLGLTARASLRQAAAKFQHWPLELDFYLRKGRSPLCPSVLARSMANFITTYLHPTGGPEIRSVSQISSSLSSGS